MVVMTKLFDSPSWLKAKLVIMVCLPVALLALPANFFDEGPPLCLSILLLDQECYGCGMTRACQHLIHADIKAAWHFNALSVIVLPILAGLLVEEFLKTLRKLKTLSKRPN